jgi:hypothetical protein
MKLVCRIALAFILTITSLQADVHCEENKNHIVITRNGQHVLTYQKTVIVPNGVDTKYGRSGFIHPISTPAGKIITDDYPLPHHSHQHGLFFAWKKATFKNEQLNFWEPDNGSIRHEKVSEIINSKQFAGFRVELAHVSRDQQILKEIWDIKVDANTGYIDFRSEQICTTNSPLTVEQYHYGGLAIRGSRQWFKDANTSEAKDALKDEFVEACKMITNEGLTQKNGNHSRPNWVCMTGKIDKTPVSITLIPHPSNFRHPQQVRLHPDMPYFCFAPMVKQSFKIEPHSPLVSHFRIIAEDGEPDPAKLNVIQQEFAQTMLTK